MKAVRKRLRDRRKKKSLRQEDVAKLAGISRNYYSQIENGERDPSFEVTRSICRVLKIDIKEW